MGEEYKVRLRDYLAAGGETDLAQAFDLGRKAVDNGLGVLDVAAIHHEALVDVLGGESWGRKESRLLNAAANFLAETLSPFEMAQKQYQEGNSVLRCLNEMLEEEAKRIAQDLHDEAGQLLASVAIALDIWATELPKGERSRLSQIRELVSQAEEQLRRLSHELRPTVLDEMGLAPALEFLAEGVAVRRGIRISVESPADLRLPNLVEKTIYRIVQEALNNVARHARASSVVIGLEPKPGAIWCRVRDDGAGFDVQEVLSRNGKAGLGLLGVRERLSSLGGKLKITSGPGRGTELQFMIPLEIQEK